MLEEKNPEVDGTVENTESTKTTAETVVEKAKSVAAEAVESVKETANEVAETVKETAAEAVETVTETAKEVSETVKETAATTVETVTKKARKTVGETAKSIKAAATQTMTEEDIDEPMPDLDEEVVDDTPHDDFDWDGGNRQVLTYSDAEIAAYIEEYDATLSSVADSQIVNGIVTAINDGDVLLDINFKSDGLVSLSEFRDTPDMKVGDSVSVYVEAQEDERGQLVLSRRKAKLLQAWESIKDSFENGTVIKGRIIHKTKGGLIADCSGLETFLPGSQIDIKPIMDYDQFVGREMEFKVVKINEQIKNAVVSHKALIESDLAEQREAIIGSLEKGQVLEGLVKNITDFGAFLDLGGVDGLLYITDISWGRISHPNQILSLNQKINVVVLDFDENKKRISLGLKQLQPHPWEVLAETIDEGSTVKGKIVNIEDYGAFLEIQPGVEGLIHVSEVSWSNQPINAREFFTMGEELDAKVVTVNRNDRKMSLSVKQMSDDPWSKISEQFPVGSRHTGKVKNLTPYGVFIEMTDGIGGMIHISDLSWTKRYNHPSEFTKVGKDIDVVILDIDQNHRKLSLGHKQTEENPWDTFENVFPVGSYHEGTIMRRDDKGGIVQLPYGLEAFAPIRHLRKEDGKLAEVDEVLTIKVIEFNRDDKRIIVSHTRYLDDIRREADDSVRAEKDAERKETRTAVKKTQEKVEKTTLGDLAGLADLKVALQGKAPTPPPLKKPAPKKEEVNVEAKEAATEAAAPVADAKVEVAADKLTKVEGIGPKIQGVLNNNGIMTFAQLAAAKAEDIKTMLTEAEGNFGFHNPTTWPEQAQMAADGKWDELKKWQDLSDGGKPIKTKSEEE